jgi:DNA-binding MarR family transcriptional regulator
MPVPAELQPLHGGIHQEIWTDYRFESRRAAVFAVPSVGSGRLRPTLNTRILGQPVAAKGTKVVTQILSAQFTYTTYSSISQRSADLDNLIWCTYNLDMEKPSPVSQTADLMARECIAVRVRLINRVVTALYDEALRPFMLRISQANILSAICHTGAVRPAEVSRILRIEKSTLSRDVELMKQRGWLESDPPSGGRNQTIRLTSDGKKLLAKIQPSWEKAQTEAKLLIGDDGELALRLIATRLGFGKSTS